MSLENTEDVQLSGIVRKAIDTVGNLGSFYDLYRDQILNKLDVKLKKPKCHKLKKTYCQIKKCETDESQNLLRMIGIQDDLRLSLLFNLVPKTGIVSLIDYPHSINEYTRFLHYTYIQREENLLNNRKKMRKYIESSRDQVDGTHIITSVRWGIDFIAVLQLPAIDEAVKKIDIVLEKICTAWKLTSAEENLLKEITNTKVYSNIPSLTTKKTICDICLDINQLKANKTDYRPVDFALHSIREITLQNNNNENDIKSQSGIHNNEIEQYLLQLSTRIKYFESFFVENVSNIQNEQLKDQLGKAYVKWLNVKHKYADEIKRFTDLVVNFRKGDAQISHINNALNDEQQRILKKGIDDLTENIKHLETKEKFIIDLQQQQFKYRNIAELNINTFDNEQKIEQILIKKFGHHRILCSDDILKNNNSLKWDQLRCQLVEEQRTNPNLNLIYADFSYCIFQLPDIITLPLPKIDNTNDISKKSTPSQSTESTSSNNEIINILLLGESGVGKSTFINAFINYLTFNTLQQAEINKPVVIIPVSFLITTGNDFQEHTVKFGNFDKSNNEDFDHPGQSVTQRCKSYVFDLKHIHGKKFRIIDTPGFGDTRGLNQDDLNMQHILEYINNLTHLNAICFLLKPNSSRLHIFFRTCLTQLLDLLGRNARENIVFCFTNARSTFYTPGDTAPLLKTMLNSLSINDIILKKENTFCFDSESFRYLVAQQNSITFNELNKQEYEHSWSTSMNESNRLLNSICNNLPKYNIDGQWKSIKHAQLEIMHMIRPILETMRNIFRNIILWNNNEKKKSIVLCPKVIKCPTTLCLSCKTSIIQLGNFSILSDSPHKCLRRCSNCKCTIDKHVSIDYTLEYKFIDNPVNHDSNRMNEQHSLLFNACIELTYFLISTTHTSKYNPFLIILMRMIDDEKKICSDNESKQLNVQLLKDLEKLKNKYEYRMHELKPNANNIELPVIYERIAITQKYPGIHEQIGTIKQGQEHMMKYYEYEIPNNLMNTSDCMTTDF